MALFSIKKKDISIIVNEMEQDIEYVDPISYIKAYHIRSIIPTYIYLIENLLGFCPKSWFKDIKYIADEIAKRQIEEAKEMALPPQLYDIFEKDLYMRELVRCLKGIELSTLDLGVIFIQAGIRGYKYSNYCYKGKYKIKSGKELPSFFSF